MIPFLGAYAAGIALAGNILSRGPFVQILFCASFCSAALFLVRIAFHMSKKTGARLSPIGIMFVLGFLSMLPWSSVLFPPLSAQAFIEKGVVRVCGTISDVSDKRSGHFVCIIDDLCLAKPGGSKIDVDGRIRVVIRGNVPDILAGDRISFDGKIRGFKNFNNPGGFDYRRYMMFKNIWGRMYVRGSDITVISRENRGLLKNRLARFRDRVEQAVGEACRNIFDDFGFEFDAEKTSAVLTALTVGKKDRITPRLREDFSRAGVSHILAISGLHIGMIAAFAFFLFKWLFSFSYLLLSRGAPSRLGAVCSVIAVLFYAMISGFSPSTQRAVLMVMIFFFAYLSGRDYDLVNTIAAAALFILVLFPPALFDISFQLSFAAVCAIFYGLSVRPKVSVFQKNNFFTRFSTRVCDFIYVSVCAIIGTAPLVMIYFNQFSIAGIFSNLILVPVMGFVAVPIGVLSVLLFSFSPAIGKAGFQVCAIILSPAISLVHAIARIPLASFKTFTPSVLEVICFYLVAAALFYLIHHGIMDRRECFRSQEEDSAHRIAAAVLAFGLVFVCCDSFYWVYERFFHKDLRATVIDVGQGSSMLIDFPGGSCMLIDGGGFYENSVFDIGKYVVAPFLWYQRIFTIDTVILSHPDSDHLNGLVYVLRHFRVGRVIENGDPSDTVEYEEFKRIIRENGVACPPFSRVTRQWRVNGAMVRILYPPGNFVHSGSKEREGGRNNHSIVVQVSYEGKSILIPGDIEAPAERRLVASEKDRLASDILISPHHGSRSSSTPAFLKAVHPNAVIVSASGNHRGLPSKTVLKRYAKLGYTVFRTDRDGAVQIRIDGSGISIEPVLYLSSSSLPQSIPRAGSGARPFLPSK